MNDNEFENNNFHFKSYWTSPNYLEEEGINSLFNSECFLSKFLNEENNRNINNEYSKFSNLIELFPISLKKIEIIENDILKMTFKKKNNIGKLNYLFIEELGQILKNSQIGKIKQIYYNNNEYNLIYLQFEEENIAIDFYNYTKNEINLLSLIDEEEEIEEKRNKQKERKKEEKNIKRKKEEEKNIKRKKEENKESSNEEIKSIILQKSYQEYIPRKTIIFLDNNKNILNSLNLKEEKIKRLKIKERKKIEREIYFKTNSLRDYELKYVCRYMIGIENEKNFQVTKKLIGNNGIILRQIINENCIKFGDNTTKIRLRGKGSGYKEGPEKKESNDPLELCLSSLNWISFCKCCRSVEFYLNKLYFDYYFYQKKCLQQKFFENKFLYYFPLSMKSIIKYFYVVNRNKNHSSYCFFDENEKNNL